MSDFTKEELGLIDDAIHDSIYEYSQYLDKHHHKVELLREIAKKIKQELTNPEK
jgi:hypothetical protein